ncbi:hypothetical protein MARPU_02580 [Marichromatium purpuratum 984]|uniref:DUF559 domain-containing protein n=1 Tax=Marichromatium purpuratum 984 TaxID=765910 RepID=W0DW94_MARPU|nr:DUF559 domain-containing protein [Marichromatium purpuratum]AHF02875.1 hypothetical protein MARPU_02580 [Marichromatium purpuratum 984]
MQPYNKSLKPFSRHLRSNMTKAEQALWQRLRRKQVHGLQFYRQKPLLGFIVDFYCPKAALVIEIDGGQHRVPEHRAKDARRDQALADISLTVLRFDNRQALNETDVVLETIHRAIDHGPT